MTTVVDKARLASLLLEKEKRNRTRRPVYTPNKGQMPVHASTAKERFVFSANGSGKTTLLANEIYCAAHGLDTITKEKLYKCPVKIVVVVDNARKVDEVLIPELRKWYDIREEQLKKEGKPNTSKLTFDNGSIVSFYSAEADPMVFEGFMADYIFIDEPLPYPLYVAAKRSLRIKGSPSRLLFCGTATNQPWLKTLIWDKWSKGEYKDVECFKVGVEVNLTNLAEGYYDRFSATLSDAEKEVRLKGGFFNSEGMALAHLWDRDVHIIEDLQWDMSWPVVVAIDPHPVKKHVAVMVGVDPDERLYVIKELALKMPAKPYAEALKKWADGYRIMDWVCDSIGNSDNNMAAEGFAPFIDTLNECGIRARATRYEEKSHEDLIDRLQSGLVIPAEPDNYGRHIPRLRVSGRCTGVINDIETVGWQRNRTTGEHRPKLDTGSKDYLSATGYALATNLFYDKPRRQRSWVVKSTPYRGIEPRHKKMIKLAQHRRGARDDE